VTENNFSICDQVAAKDECGTSLPVRMCW